MRERIAGCLICLVAMLTWEALTASSRETVRIPPPAVQGGALVALSEGIIGAKSLADAPLDLIAEAPEPQIADAGVLEWVEELMPVVAPCEPVVVAACDVQKRPHRRAHRDHGEDAGLGNQAQLVHDTANGTSASWPSARLEP